MTNKNSFTKDLETRSHKILLDVAERRIRQLERNIADTGYNHYLAMRHKRNVIMTLTGIIAFMLVITAISLKSNYDRIGEVEKLKELIIKK